MKHTPPPNITDKSYSINITEQHKARALKHVYVLQFF